MLLLALAACGTFFSKAPRAGEVAVLQEAGTAVCEYAEAPGALLVDYRVISAEVAGGEPLQRLQVYGDGRVRVQRPAFVKMPGDYELRLSREEVRDLIAALAAYGVFDFDENRARAALKTRIDAARAREVREGRPARVTATLDADVTLLEVFLERYTPADRGRPLQLNLARRIAWRNLAADGREHPQIPEIAGLAKSVEGLSRLAARTDLERIDP